MSFYKTQLKILQKIGIRSGIEIMSMFSYGISCWIQHLETSEPPKSTKGHTVPEIKDRQCLQIIWAGKAKWYEIMSMFPTALAAESNT